MCFSTVNPQAAASQSAYADYFHQQVPNSRFAGNPGVSALFGTILAKKNGISFGGQQGQQSSGSATQPVKQHTGG